MTPRPRALLPALLLACAAAACAGPPIRPVTPETLWAVLAAPIPDGTWLHLAPGTYVLRPTAYEDFTAGAGEDEPRRLLTTAGLVVRGRDIHLRGSGAERTVLVTGAGYGIVFEDAQECSLSALTVTGGVRTPPQFVGTDAEGAPLHRTTPDAAVVITGDSLVFVQDCDVRDNLGDETVVMSGAGGLPATVSGIMGINVRDGGSAVIRSNRVTGNSWDGIACYRNAHAVIEDNLVDGGENNGRAFGGGRGVGIGITLNPYAELRGNLVRRYWKGIGFFVSPTAICEENVVQEMLTWGLSIWDAGHGAPSVLAERNLIDGTGACGVAVTLTDPDSRGSLRDNLIARSGQDERYDGGDTYCRQCAVALHGVVEGFEVAGNVSWSSREPDGRPGAEDVDDATFRARLAGLRESLLHWPAAGAARLLAADPGGPLAQGACGASPSRR
jgi:hypothetical protein